MTRVYKRIRDRKNMEQKERHILERFIIMSESLREKDREREKERGKMKERERQRERQREREIEKEGERKRKRIVVKW